MNANEISSEEYQNSEAWLAEQIFSQLKDFNTEPSISNNELYQLKSNHNPNQDQEINSADGTITSDVLDLNESAIDKFSEKLANEENVLRTITNEEEIVLQTINPLKQEINSQEVPVLNEQLIQNFDPSNLFPQNNLQIVECANCNCIFDFSSFNQHVCDYGEDNKLIIPEPIEHVSSPYQSRPIEPACVRLLRENQIRIRRFLKEELKYDINAGCANSKKQNGPHECTLCERKFVHASGLSRHMEKHALDLIPTTISSHSNNGYQPMNSLKAVIKCSFCGRIFFETESAYKHFCMHFTDTLNEERELDGNTGFPYENYLDDALEFLKTESKSLDDKPTEYMKIVILNCVLQCEFCDFLFSDVCHLFRHSACHHPRKPFECTSCEIHVFNAKVISIHWQAECVFARENIKNGNASQRYYVCNVCENKFGSLEQLHEHRYTAYHFFPRMDPIQQILLLPCEYCEQAFESASEIVNHFEEKHYKKNKRDTAAKYRQYLCDVCGKTYTQSSHLWQHLRFHKGVKPFSCKEPGCSRKFTIRPDLNDHIRKCHTGERPYHCLICGRRFLTGSVFYQHRLIHRGERRYGCDECGKRFYRADALKNHHRIHTGEKPYGCLFCTKNFRQRGDRDKHIRARHSSLDANARLMMQMRKLQLEAAARAASSTTTPAEEVLMLGNIPFPKSMFQPMLPDIEANQN